LHQETAILVGVHLKSKEKKDCLNSLNELHELSKAANLLVRDSIIQVRGKLSPKFIIGKGKLEELSSLISLNPVDTVIFDEDISPVQLRNIESILKCKVLGRTELIMDIFASRARTKQARLQVEYAQLSYLMPRLTRRWTHLSRIEGGIGFRGPGETQLEVDRRAIKKRLFTIKKQLNKIATQSETRRKKRLDKDIVCLVGYTNVGKSTLMNNLSKDKLHVDDAYFATLDSTVRKAFISQDLSILLIDTIGFISKLPHQLITSFKTTLEEVKSARLLLHVVDITDDNLHDKIETVNNVLRELDSLDKPMIYVFNKVDKLPDDMDLPSKLRASHQSSCFTSASNNYGIDRLKVLIEKAIASEGI